MNGAAAGGRMMPAVHFDHSAFVVHGLRPRPITQRMIGAGLVSPFRRHVELSMRSLVCSFSCVSGSLRGKPFVSGHDRVVVHRSISFVFGLTPLDRRQVFPETLQRAGPATPVRVTCRDRLEDGLMQGQLRLALVLL